MIHSQHWFLLEQGAPSPKRHFASPTKLVPPKIKKKNGRKSNKDNNLLFKKMACCPLPKKNSQQKVIISQSVCYDR